jgi:hypothetical protein
VHAVAFLVTRGGNQSLASTQTYFFTNHSFLGLVYNNQNNNNNHETTAALCFVAGGFSNGGDGSCPPNKATANIVNPICPDECQYGPRNSGFERRHDHSALVLAIDEWSHHTSGPW